MLLFKKGEEIKCIKAVVSIVNVLEIFTMRKNKVILKRNWIYFFSTKPFLLFKIARYCNLANV